MEFTDKKILITGASPDFGLTLSIYFAQQGSELFLLAQTQEEIDTTVKIVNEVAPDTKIHTFVVDLCKKDQIAHFGEAIAKVTETLDILFHNASLWLPGDTVDADDTVIANVVNSTVTGTALVTKKVLPLLLRSETPDIINLLAKCALANDRHHTSSEIFSAAKYAHAAFADRLRARHRGTGLRVMSLYPPNFYNPDYLNKEDWHKRREAKEGTLPTARNVLDTIVFALSQDRICSMDDIVMSNTLTDYL